MATIAERVATTQGKRPFRLPSRGELIAWVWIAPAVFFAAVFLVYPVIYTIWLSLQNSDSSAFVGLKNFGRIFHDGGLLEAVRNNILWIILGTIATVFIGLVIAVLVDRVRIEGAAKSAIFIPMALSFVAAGVIWRLVYVPAPKGQTQTGLLDALLTRFGLPPQYWLIDPHFNNFAMIAVYVWMWTGFCMVILSAALKGVSADVLEAARVDGASELMIFWRILVPMISPTLVVVATTMVINLLKIFDIVYVMTGGDFGTNVISVSYYQQLFNFGNNGIGSALAVLLMLGVIPIMYFNVRRYRQEVRR